MEMRSNKGKVKVDILNFAYTAEDEFIQTQFSGEIADLPERVKEVVTLEDAQDMEAGDWITIIDGEVVEVGEFHGHLIRWNAEDTLKDELTVQEREALLTLFAQLGQTPNEHCRTLKTVEGEALEKVRKHLTD